MTKGSEIHTDGKDWEPRSALDVLCLEGAQRMLHRALEGEVARYLERHRDARDENGRALVTRNGKARPRKLTVGSGTMEVSAPRVREQRVDGNGERVRFTSEFLLPYAEGTVGSARTQTAVLPATPLTA